MKKLFSIIFLSICSLTLQAQQWVLDEVDAKYKSAQQLIANYQENPQQKNCLSIEKSYVMPAIGLVKETIEFFAIDDNDPEDNPGGTHFALNFIRRTIDGGAPTAVGISYYEYLFDTESGHLIYYLKKSNDIRQDKPVTVESIHYYDRDGLFCIGNKKYLDPKNGKELSVAEKLEDGNEGLEQAEYLCPIFDQLMNSGI